MPYLNNDERDEDYQGPPSQGFGRDRRDNHIIYEKLDQTKYELINSVNEIKSQVYREINKALENQVQMNIKIVQLTSQVELLNWVGKLIASAIILAILGSLLALIFRQ